MQEQSYRTESVAVSLTRDKRLPDGRLRFAEPLVDRLSEGPQAKMLMVWGRNDLLVKMPDAEVVKQVLPRRRFDVVTSCREFAGAIAEVIIETFSH